MGMNANSETPERDKRKGSQPTLLAGPLAGLAALRLGTVTLTILIAKIGDKEIVATAALASLGPDIHRPRNHHQARPQSK